MLLLNQHILFKGEASTSFEILVKDQLVFFGKWREINTQPCKPMQQLQEIHIASLTNPYQNK